MGQNSKIEWTDYTWSPWHGCTKVSAGCANCYAAAGSVRNPGTLGVWGSNGTRVVAAESSWRQVEKWNRQAKADGLRRRVFPSVCDPFEEWTGPMENAHGVQWWKRGDGTWTTSDHYRDTVALTMADVRQRLFSLIRDCEYLDFLLLTKRPENVIPQMSRLQGWAVSNLWDEWRAYPDNLHNVWLLTSVENQKTADARIPELLKIPARVRGLSCEPLLGPVDIWRSVRLAEERDDVQAAWDQQVMPRRGEQHLHWCIVGGESGHGARPMQLDWVRSLQNQCDGTGVAFFFKQAGSNPYDWSRGDPPNHQPSELVRLHLRDRKGGDIEEFPPSLRVRQFPEVA